MIIRVNLASDGSQATTHDWGGSMSADGRYVSFTSAANNLVPGDTNRLPVKDYGSPDANFHAGPPGPAPDVFVLDRETGVLERVSVAGDGSQGNNESGGGGLSADGHWVLFQSGATNLVEGDTNGVMDAFVHDRLTGATERVSVATGGGQGNGGSSPFGISADGRYVFFHSYADNLVPGDTNEVIDIFVRDRERGITERISLGAEGEQGNGVSIAGMVTSDGRFVVFQSAADNLVPRDTNKVDDVFVRDRLEGTTERVSVNSKGAGGNHASYGGAISADGRFVVFDSDASNLVSGDTSSLRRDVFLFDRQTRAITRLSVGPKGNEANNSSGSSDISADGRYVAFQSYASNLVPGDTNRKKDVFVLDRKTGLVRRVSLSADGEQQNGESMGLTISADGAWVAFMSLASNLVPGDTNEIDDLFVTRAVR
jgi:Tol biopolymer transport system component